MAERLADMLNLGPATERYLHDVGIATPDDLERIGSVDAYVRLKQAFPKQVNKVFLYALEGALLDIPCLQLPAEVKDRIVAEATARLDP